MRLKKDVVVDWKIQGQLLGVEIDVRAGETQDQLGLLGVDVADTLEDPGRNEKSVADSFLVQIRPQSPTSI